MRNGCRTPRHCPECGDSLYFVLRYPDPEISSSYDCPNGHRWRCVEAPDKFAPFELAPVPQRVGTPVGEPEPPSDR